MKKQGSKFRIEAPLIHNPVNELAADSYAKQANSNEKFMSLDSKKSEKATRGFNVPLNDYELELLRKISLKYDRSARKITRRLLVEALERELEK